MTEEQIEKAARKMCEIRGCDPEYRPMTSDESYVEVYAKAVRWHFDISAAIASVCEPHGRVVEVDLADYLDPPPGREAAEAAQAFGHAMLNQPTDLAPPPDLAVLGISVREEDNCWIYSTEKPPSWRKDLAEISIRMTPEQIRAVAADAERRAETKKAPGTPG